MCPPILWRRHNHPQHVESLWVGPNIDGWNTRFDRFGYMESNFGPWRSIIVSTEKACFKELSQFYRVLRCISPSFSRLESQDRGLLSINAKDGSTVPWSSVEASRVAMWFAWHGNMEICTNDFNLGSI